VAQAPVHVPNPVMDRLAVVMPGEDVVAPFLPPAQTPSTSLRQSPRFEPRNMSFTNGCQPDQVRRLPERRRPTSSSATRGECAFPNWPSAGRVSRTSFGIDIRETSNKLGMRTYVNPQARRARVNPEVDESVE
jgi:hypothetical protein